MQTQSYSPVVETLQPIDVATVTGLTADQITILYERLISPSYNTLLLPDSLTVSQLDSITSLYAKNGSTPYTPKSN